MQQKIKIDKTKIDKRKMNLMLNNIKREANNEICYFLCSNYQRNLGFISKYFDNN